MALTPEDVVTKEFGRPKSFGRSGYDEGQVDDFLDDIVVELRRLNEENEKLSTQLEDCRRSKGTPGREGAGQGVPSSGAATVPGLTPVPAPGGNDRATDPAEVRAAEQKLSAVKTETGRAEEAARAAKESQAQAEKQLAAVRAELERTQAAQKQAQEQASAASSAPVQGGTDQGAAAAHGQAQPAPGETGSSAGATALAAGAAGGGGAAGVIALAQRLHDEHVSEGQKTKDRLVGEGETYRDKVVGEANTKRDELIRSGQSRHDELVSTGQKKHDELVSTGQTEHDRLVKEGTDRSTTMVADAESEKATIIGQLNTERQRLSGDIEGLRGFERDYRGKLKSFLTDQMSFLDTVKTEPQGQGDGQNASQG